MQTISVKTWHPTSIKDYSLQQLITNLTDAVSNAYDEFKLQKQQKITPILSDIEQTINAIEGNTQQLKELAKSESLLVTLLDKKEITQDKFTLELRTIQEHRKRIETEILLHKSRLSEAYARMDEQLREKLIFIAPDMYFTALKKSKMLYSRKKNIEKQITAMSERLQKIQQQEDSHSIDESSKQATDVQENSVESAAEIEQSIAQLRHELSQIITTIRDAFVAGNVSIPIGDFSSSDVFYDRLEEAYFSRNSLDNVIHQLGDFSHDKQDLIIVAGSMQWISAKDNSPKAWKERQESIQRYHSYLPGGSVDLIDVRQSFVTQRNNYNTAMILSAGRCHLYDKKICTISYAHEDFESNVAGFMSGERSNFFTIDGIQFAIEICLDHHYGVATQQGSKSDVDIHILLSKSQENVTKYVIGKSTIFIHHDEQEECYEPCLERCGVWEKKTAVMQRDFRVHETTELNRLESFEQGEFRTNRIDIKLINPGSPSTLVSTRTLVSRAVVTSLSEQQQPTSTAHRTDLGPPAASDKPSRQCLLQ